MNGHRMNWLGPVWRFLIDQDGKMRAMVSYPAAATPADLVADGNGAIAARGLSGLSARNRQPASSGDSRRRKFPLVAYLALLAVGVPAAHAEGVRVVRPGEPIKFDIPAQPLAGALQLYGQTTGIQVLYESNSAVRRTSSAVQGKFAADAALNLLLTGTDLKVRYIRPDVITLALPNADDSGVTSSTDSPASLDLSLGTLRIRGSSDGDDSARLQDYSRSVQMDIQNALRKNARTRDGSYRAVLDLWIDSTSTIERTELFRSTGDHERDAAVASTLRGVTMSRPTPANTPQPVRVVIVVRSLP
jgi:hypothetical protein